MEDRKKKLMWKKNFVNKITWSINSNSNVQQSRAIDKIIQHNYNNDRFGRKQMFKRKYSNEKVEYNEMT